MHITDLTSHEASTPHPRCYSATIYFISLLGPMDSDTRHFRNALGTFATGVTVITTIDAHTQPIGITVSSFNAVSLVPPLVVWSLGEKSQYLASFAPGQTHLIHVLAAHQENIARHFANSGINKFTDIAHQSTATGIPLLADCAAYFECRTQAVYPGGDHNIIIAHVEHFSYSNHAPLLFHHGQFSYIKRDKDDETIAPKR
ncbi:MAG: flavin reductase family protein [Ottowia sp.]|nr:flavin reductase family protein [Ottowia sp.]